MATDRQTTRTTVVVYQDQIDWLTALARQEDRTVRAQLRWVLDYARGGLVRDGVIPYPDDFDVDGIEQARR